MFLHIIGGSANKHIEDDENDAKGKKNKQENKNGHYIPQMPK